MSHDQPTDTTATVAVAGTITGDDYRYDPGCHHLDHSPLAERPDLVAYQQGQVDGGLMRHQQLLKDGFAVKCYRDPKKHDIRFGYYHPETKKWSMDSGASKDYRTALTVAGYVHITGASIGSCGNAYTNSSGAQTLFDDPAIKPPHLIDRHTIPSAKRLGDYVQAVKLYGSSILGDDRGVAPPDGTYSPLDVYLEAVLCAYRNWIYDEHVTNAEDDARWTDSAVDAAVGALNKVPKVAVTRGGATTMYWENRMFYIQTKPQKDKDFKRLGSNESTVRSDVTGARYEAHMMKLPSEGGLDRRIVQMHGQLDVALGGNLTGVDVPPAAKARVLRHELRPGGLAFVTLTCGGVYDYVFEGVPGRSLRSEITHLELVGNGPTDTTASRAAAAIADRQRVMLEIVRKRKALSSGPAVAVITTEGGRPCKPADQGGSAGKRQKTELDILGDSSDGTADEGSDSDGVFETMALS